MEGHAWASYSANRKLTRKRSFRNLEKEINYKAKRTKKPSNNLTEQKLNKIGQQTQKRTWLRVGLMLFSVVCLIAWWLLQNFL